MPHMIIFKAHDDLPSQIWKPICHSHIEKRRQVSDALRNGARQERATQVSAAQNITHMLGYESKTAYITWRMQCIWPFTFKFVLPSIHYEPIWIGPSNPFGPTDETMIRNILPMIDVSIERRSLTSSWGLSNSQCSRKFAPQGFAHRCHCHPQHQRYDFICFLYILIDTYEGRI